MPITSCKKTRRSVFLPLWFLLVLVISRYIHIRQCNTCFHSHCTCRHRMCGHAVHRRGSRWRTEHPPGKPPPPQDAGGSARSPRRTSASGASRKHRHASTRQETGLPDPEGLKRNSLERNETKGKGRKGKNTAGHTLPPAPYQVSIFSTTKVKCPLSCRIPVTLPTFPTQ